MDEEHLSTAATSALVARLFAMTRELGPGRTLADPRHATLAALLDAIDADEDALTLARDAVDILGHYLEFLDDTNSWNISDEEFDASYEVLDDVLDEIDSGQPGILRTLMDALDEVPDVAVPDQLRAINALPLITGVDGLLTWIGRSHPITSTGALRLRDIQPVAALLGINAVGRKRTDTTESGATESDNTADRTVEVSTMWELPGLTAWWQGLVGLGVLELTPTTVRPGPTAAAWRSSAAREHFALRSTLVRLYVSFWPHTEPDGAGILGPFVFVHLIAQLAAAVSPDALGELSATALAAILDESANVAGFAFEGFRDFGGIAGIRSSITLGHLARVGILEESTTADGSARYIVPAALRPVVAESLREVRETLLKPDDDDLLDDDLIDEDMLAEDMLANPHPAGTLLQLKIALVDARPAVWRRILVEADATLGELHDVIQQSFLWDDRHLHRFTLDNDYSGGPAFGPVPDEVLGGTDRGLYDENLMELGALLREPADDLFYTYNPGNEWRHLIRLEAIHPAGFARAPSCIDGRGAAPHEESGGPSGWALHVRGGAIAAPFDLDAVNARLVRLRGNL